MTVRRRSTDISFASQGVRAEFYGRIQNAMATYGGDDLVASEIPTSHGVTALRIDEFCGTL